MARSRQFAVRPDLVLDDEWEQPAVNKPELQTFTPLGIFALAMSFFIVGAAAMYWAIRM